MIFSHLLSKGRIFISSFLPAVRCIFVTNLILSFRTETVVEKLLTNWMSICLYAFVRVSSLSLCEGAKRGAAATALLCASLLAGTVLEPSCISGKRDV